MRWMAIDEANPSYLALYASHKGIVDLVLGTYPSSLRHARAGSSTAQAVSPRVVGPTGGTHGGVTRGTHGGAYGSTRAGLGSAAAGGPGTAPPAASEAQWSLHHFHALGSRTGVINGGSARSFGAHSNAAPTQLPLLFPGSARPSGPLPVTHLVTALRRPWSSSPRVRLAADEEEQQAASASLLYGGGISGLSRHAPSRIVTTRFELNSTGGASRLAALGNAPYWRQLAAAHPAALAPASSPTSCALLSDDLLDVFDIARPQLRVALAVLERLGVAERAGAGHRIPNRHTLACPATWPCQPKQHTLAFTATWPCLPKQHPCMPRYMDMALA